MAGGLGRYQPLGSALNEVAKRMRGVAGEAPTAQVDPAKIDQIRAVAHFYETRAMVVGGGAEDDHGEQYTAALVSVRDVEALLRSHHPNHLDADLYAAAAWLFRAVGFLAFDTNRRTIANDLLSAAQECAVHAGNPSLEARIIGTRARTEAWNGDPQAGALLAQRALELPGLTPTELSMLYSVQARALARMGLWQPTLTAVGQSDEALAGALPGEMIARPWSTFFDQPHQQGDTGRALLDLAWAASDDVSPQSVARALDTADLRHRASLSQYDTGTNRRSASMTALNLAATQALRGAPDEALATGREAIDMQAGVTSQRVAEHLTMVSAACDRCAGNPAADELREAVCNAA